MVFILLLVFLEDVLIVDGMHGTRDLCDQKCCCHGRLACHMELGNIWPRLLVFNTLQNRHFLEWFQLDGSCYHIIHANNAMVGKHLFQLAICIEALLTKEALTLLAKSHG